VVVADPAEAEMSRAEEAALRDERRRLALATERGLPHLTADGEPFLLLCNVASDLEVRLGRDSGAGGVGLLRTELPFLEADRWPVEVDHRRALRPVFAEAAGWPVTVRLLDFTNDKVPPFLRDRPAGLAALLDDAAALRAQLRAVLQVGRAASVQIMVPMVTAADELRTIRAAVDAVAAELQAPPVPVGSMVETVEAVDKVAALCEVADFLSIGTNDLTAQVLDLDRRDPRARPELTAHPSVLNLIGRVVDAGRRAGRPVSVCGDAGAHPLTLPLLLGAGVRAVSVSCARIDETRYRMRRLDTRRCAEVLTEAMHRRSADEAMTLVSERIGVAVR
jgi:phosphoenolpyruvate-protein kinase (PTS system EI component)